MELMILEITLSLRELTGTTLGTVSFLYFFFCFIIYLLLPHFSSSMIIIVYSENLSVFMLLQKNPSWVLMTVLWDILLKVSITLKLDSWMSNTLLHDCVISLYPLCVRVYPRVCWPVEHLLFALVNTVFVSDHA